jgi:hypothetical protein
MLFRLIQLDAESSMAVSLLFELHLPILRSCGPSPLSWQSLGFTEKLHSRRKH